MGYLDQAGPNSRYPEPESLQDLLRTSDVAALFQVSTRTVSEWARRGRVPCMRTPGGQWRYPADPIRRLVTMAERSPWGEDGPPVGAGLAAAGEAQAS